jgi:hypothetical protein
MTQFGPDPRGQSAEPQPQPQPQHSLVRPYMLTRGRTSSSLGVFELHAPALALVTPEQLGRGATPEDRRIVELCQTPMSVAEVAARMGTPVGVVRVLVGDLVVARMLHVRQSDDHAEHRDVRLLERLLEGIRAI